MKKRIFFPATILLVIIALVLHFTARAQILEGQHLKSKSIEAAMEKQTQVVDDPTAKSLSNNGRIFNNVGLVFALCSLICLVLALLRREPGWYSIPILLLLSDLTVQMLL